MRRVDSFTLPPTLRGLILWPERELLRPDVPGGAEFLETALDFYHGQVGVIATLDMEEMLDLEELQRLFGEELQQLFGEELQRLFGEELQRLFGAFGEPGNRIAQDHWSCAVESSDAGQVIESAAIRLRSSSAPMGLPHTEVAFITDAPLRALIAARYQCGAVILVSRESDRQVQIVIDTILSTAEINLLRYMRVVPSLASLDFS